MKYLKLLRINQWYKNLVIFLALFFSENLFNFELFLKTLMGFFSLCFICSSYYIINDIKDLEFDKKHPEKKKRPLPSGLIKVGTAKMISIILFAFSVIFAYFINSYFIVFPLALFLLSVLYTFYFKNIPILDVHIIAINFLLRAVSGGYVINVTVSPWLIILVFLLGLFLALCKRRSNLEFLGEKAKEFKKIFNFYNKEILDMFIVCILAVFLTAYSFYSFLVRENFLLSLPIMTFILFRYTYLISKNSKIGRDVENALKDIQILGASLILFLTVFVLIYVV